MIRGYSLGYVIVKEGKYYSDVWINHGGISQTGHWTPLPLEATSFNRRNHANRKRKDIAEKVSSDTGEKYSRELKKMRVQRST